MTLRNSQVVVETLETESNPKLRNSQVVVETLETESNPTTRVSQVVVEIFEGIIARYGFLGSDDDPPPAASWIILEGTPNIQSNKLELLATSSTLKEKIKHRKKITGDFQIVLDFQILAAPSITPDYEFGLRLQISSTKYLQFSFGHDGVKYLYVRYADGGGENVTSTSMHGTFISKMVVKKVGNTLRCWYLADSTGYQELGTGYTVGLAGDEFSIYLFTETSDDEPNAGFAIEELAIVKGDLVDPELSNINVNIIT